MVHLYLLSFRNLDTIVADTVVLPEAGIHLFEIIDVCSFLDVRLRGHDELKLGLFREKMR